MICKHERRLSRVAQIDTWTRFHEKKYAENDKVGYVSYESSSKVFCSRHNVICIKYLTPHENLTAGL